MIMKMRTILNDYNFDNKAHSSDQGFDRVPGDEPRSSNEEPQFSDRERDVSKEENKTDG